MHFNSPFLGYVTLFSKLKCLLPQDGKVGGQPWGCRVSGRDRGFSGKVGGQPCVAGAGPQSGAGLAVTCPSRLPPGSLDATRMGTLLFQSHTHVSVSRRGSVTQNRDRSNFSSHSAWATEALCDTLCDARRKGKDA